MEFNLAFKGLNIIDK